MNYPIVIPKEGRSIKLKEPIGKIELDRTIELKNPIRSLEEGMTIKLNRPIGMLGGVLVA